MNSLQFLGVAVVCSIAEKQGMRRGWFTYTDLCVLLDHSAWSHALAAVYQHFLKVRNLFSSEQWSQNRRGF